MTKEKRSKSNIVIWVLLLAVIVVGLYFFFTWFYGQGIVDTDLKACCTANSGQFKEVHFLIWNSATCEIGGEACETCSCVTGGG
jgi:flagellar basal body-associated protein FliL